jgi:hypothetical protein
MNRLTFAAYVANRAQINSHILFTGPESKGRTATLCMSNASKRNAVAHMPRCRQPNATPFYGRYQSMVDILTRLAALTEKDRSGLLPCAVCGHPNEVDGIKPTIESNRRRVVCTHCGITTTWCDSAADAIARANDRPRESALLALVQEAAAEIERLKQWQTVALAIGEREEERRTERKPPEPFCPYCGVKGNALHDTEFPHPPEGAP